MTFFIPNFNFVYDSMLNKFLKCFIEGIVTLFKIFCQIFLLILWFEGKERRNAKTPLAVADNLLSFRIFIGIVE